MTTKAAERERMARRKRAPGTPVLHVITSSTRRGAETFAVDLAEALAQRGHDGRIVALIPGGDGGLPVPALGRRRIAPSTLRALRRETRLANVVVAHGSSAVVACALATVGVATPFVYRNIGDPSFWLDTPRRRAQMRWILRRAAVTVALWNDSAARLDEIGGGIDVRIIPTGVPARLFPAPAAAAKRRARERLGLGGAKIVALYVGSLSAEKDVATAIRAVGALTDVALIVVGDGPDRGALEALAGRVAAGRVLFGGSRPRPTEEIAASDVLVLTSRTEGIPAVVIEAAFAGVPAVASAVGGIPEIVEHGRSGFVVPPGDVAAFSTRIREAAGDAEALGRAARRRCMERFEIGPVAAAWDALLADLGAWDVAR